MDPSIDSIDLELLEALQQDGRLSNAALADRIKLSPSATLRRVKRLQNDGIIKRFSAVLNTQQIGCGTSIFVNVTLDNQREETLQAFERAAAMCRNILACHLVAGEADYVLHVVADGVVDFERVHQEVLVTLPGVTRIKSTVALRTVYRRSQLPIR